MQHVTIWELVNRDSRYILLALIFLCGTVFGSFISVLFLRYPYKFDLQGRSACPSCDTKLNALELIPVLSYIFLRGRCKSCKTKISVIYPVLEITTGFLFLLPLFYSKSWIQLCAWQIFIVTGLALSLIDARHKKLPNELTFGLILIELILLGIDSINSGNITNFRNAVLFSLLTFSLFLGVSLFSNGGLGMGDVKFFASISLLDGYISGFTVYVSIMLGLIFAGIFSLYLVLLKREGRKASIPLGPFIFFGAILGPTFTVYAHNFIFS